MRSCFPRDRPSTASGWAAIAATYTSKVEGDSLCSNLSCRKKALLQSCTFVGFLGEKNTSSRTDSTSMHRLALLKELYSEWWSLPLKSATSHPGATGEGSTDLDASAIWCRAPEKGGPSSKECAREGLSWEEWVRETRSGWASMVRPAGPAPHPPWPCTVSVWAGSLGETHTCLKSEASCVLVLPCRGGP